jgi:hypothetical protein
MSEYLLLLIGADSTSPSQPVAIGPLAQNVHPGDVVISAVVIDPGTGVVPLGSDVTTTYNAGPVQTVPQAKNISVGGVADIMANVVIQAAGSNLANAKVLALMQRPGQ